MFTRDGQYARYFLAGTRTNPGVARHRGITLLLVPMHLPGRTVEPLFTLSAERTNVVYFDDVRVSDCYRFGEVDAGWPIRNGSSGPRTVEQGRSARVERIDRPRLNSASVFALERAFGAAVEWANTHDDQAHSRAQESSLGRQLREVALALEVAEVAQPPLCTVITFDVLIRGARASLEWGGPESSSNRRSRADLVAAGWNTRIALRKVRRATEARSECSET
jgi:alkylation response protein AidB-like acyl-CoA dehydrogenase